jgi:hypothetical protein
LGARRKNGRLAGNMYQDKLREGVLSLTEKQIDARRTTASIMGKSPKTDAQKSAARKVCGLLARYRWYKKKEENPLPYAEWQGVCNHKIVSIEDAGVEDVYDITVDKYHNFALESGVFVHNCGYFYMPYEYLTTPNLSADFWTLRKVRHDIQDNIDPEPIPEPRTRGWCQNAFKAAQSFVNAAVADADGPGETTVDTMVTSGFRGLQKYLRRAGKVVDRQE